MTLILGGLPRLVSAILLANAQRAGFAVLFEISHIDKNY
jgi:hypothetical protein